MKSQNVLLTRNWDTAKIADVGVARFAKAVDVAGNEDLASAVASQRTANQSAACLSFARNSNNIGATLRWVLFLTSLELNRLFQVLQWAHLRMRPLRCCSVSTLESRCGPNVNECAYVAHAQAYMHPECPQPDVPASGARHGCLGPTCSARQTAQNSLPLLHLQVSHQFRLVDIALGTHPLSLHLQCDIYSYGVILWEIITGATATRGRLHEPEVRAARGAAVGLIPVRAQAGRTCVGFCRP